MLQTALLTIISGLEENYPGLHLNLSQLENDPKVLRAGLLLEIARVVAGTHKAKTIHRALRALTRNYPKNTICPITLDEIDLGDIDSYFALSTGHIFSRCPFYAQSLAQNRDGWFYPSNKEMYSLHDIDYIESIYQIKRPALVIRAAMTPHGPVILQPDGTVILVRENGREVLHQMHAIPILLGIATRAYPIYNSLADLLAVHRVVPSVPVQQAGTEPATRGPRQDEGSSVDASSVPSSSTETPDEHASINNTAAQATRRPWLNSMFHRNVRPDEPSRSPGSRNCQVCVML